MKKYFHVSFLIPVLLLAACTAHYPVNESIMAIDPLSGYRLGISQQSTVRSESLLVTLAFSGGGTRAAAFSYGVLEALREINITWDGKQRRLLDEIDTISYCAAARGTWAGSPRWP